MSKRKEKYGMS